MSADEIQITIPKDKVLPLERNQVHPMNLDIADLIDQSATGLPDGKHSGLVPILTGTFSFHFRIEPYSPRTFSTFTEPYQSRDWFVHDHPVVV